MKRRREDGRDKNLINLSHQRLARSWGKYLREAVCIKLLLLLLLVSMEKEGPELNGFPSVDTVHGWGKHLLFSVICDLWISPSYCRF